MGTVSTDHSTNPHTLIKMHYNVGIISTFLFLLKVAIAFRLEIDINRQQSEQNGCGCEEKSNLINLRSKILTPQDFMRDHGKLWLGSIEASITKDCIKLCPIKSARTSHFTFENQSICHCYADLKPFHCEEEQGVDLVPVMCLEKIRPPSPLNRPIFGFGFGSRRPMPRSPSSPTSTIKTTTAKQQIERRKYKLLTTFNSKNATATSTSVLVILALIA